MGPSHPLDKGRFRRDTNILTSFYPNGLSRRTQEERHPGMMSPQRAEVSRRRERRIGILPGILKKTCEIYKKQISASLYAVQLSRKKTFNRFIDYRPKSVFLS
jgi:hypothetical protein